MRKKGNTFVKTAQDVLVGLSVLTRYNNKMYRIDEILFDLNPMSTFDYHGAPITYAEYYKKNYDIDIKDKGQPLLLNRYEKLKILSLNFLLTTRSQLSPKEPRERFKEKRTKRSSFASFRSCVI